jgi:predicted Fe-Mo cluster-binding NifX family protein
MKIAISHWQGRVSPVFDESRQLLLVHILTNGEMRFADKKLLNSDPLLRAKDVVNFGTDVLICGAISLTLERALISENVKVIPHTRGPIMDVLDAFMHDKLSDPVFLLPGCGIKRNRVRI